MKFQLRFFRCLSLFLTLAISIPAVPVFAAEGSVANLLNLPEDQINLAEALAAIDREGSKVMLKEDIDEAATKQAILDLTERAAAKTAGIENLEEKIKALSRFLFEDEKFVFDHENFKDPKNLFMNSVLQRKKGMCLSLSMIYLLAAERISLPLSGVAVPSHFFVRYENGEKIVNIETSKQGNYFSSEHYAKKYKFNPQYEFYLRSLTKKESLATYLGHLADIYFDRGLTEEAFEIGQQLVKTYPNYANAQDLIGRYYWRKGEYDKAVASFEKVLAINPLEAQTLSHLGAVYFLKKDLKRGEKYMKEAVIVNPENAVAHYNYGYFLEQTGNPGQAMKEYKKAIELRADYMEPHVKIGGLNFKKGKVDEAIKEYERAVAINDQEPNVRILLGIAYAKKSNHRKALPQFEKNISLDAKSIAGHHLLAWTHVYLKDLGKAREYYKQALELGTKKDPELEKALKG